LARRTTLVDKTRLVRAKAHAINVNLRRRNDDKLAVVRRINEELADIAERVAGQADAVVRNARRKLRTPRDQVSGRARAAVDLLERTAALTRRVAAQTRQRLAGQTPDGASRVVSLHDADARPIVKGRLGKPVEFGYKAQVVDNEDGVIVDHNVEAGNPSDAEQLAPAIRRIKRRTGRAPRTVVADRGYGEQAVENELRDEGVRYPVLPRKGRPTATRRQVEARRAFRKHVRWRTGCEGRINCVKRDFALNRTRLDGLDGARTWCGHGVFNHNLVKISRLIEQPAS
jgi:IS5 family transposase